VIHAHSNEEASMSKVKMATELPVAAQRVWELIGGFNALPDWHPAVAKSKVEKSGDDVIRTLSLVGGGTIVEKLETISDAERAYSYSIQDSPLPVADYMATIDVKEDDSGHCTVEWSGEFKPHGASAADAEAAIRGIYEAGLENLKKMMGG
jgi:hypothetical protein